MDGVYSYVYVDIARDAVKWNAIRVPVATCTSTQKMEISSLPIVWLLPSSLIVIYDSCFVLSRPHSLPGGSLDHFFIPC